MDRLNSQTTDNVMSIKKYTWKDKEFPQEDGKYKFTGIIFYASFDFVTSMNVDAMIRVDVKNKLVKLAGKYHHASNCHGDFVGPIV